MKTVCIVGKPNVGKSSIFNRLVKEKKSIILDTPGVTRDRIYSKCNLGSKTFYLIDTGGVTLGKDDFAKDILVQVELAINEADIVLFVVDGLTEISELDLIVSDMLHKSSKDVIVVVNKLDNEKRKNNIYNYYELGFENVLGVSAEHNLGFDKLTELLSSMIPDETEKEASDKLKFCLIGRPNVGKSSLVNALLNESRVIVNSKAGTTTDAIDIEFKYNREDMVIIDTAGMRKKGKVYESVERYSLLRSMKAIDRSDVCVIVLDASTGILEHDKHIVSYALDAGKGMVLAVNKWDTVTDPNTKIKEWKKAIENEFQFIPYVHTVFLSAKTKKRVSTLMPEVILAYNNNKKEVKTSVLNNIIMESLSLHTPPSYKGKRLKIYFASQTSSKPPKFTMQVNDKGLIHFSYERYLENQIRKNIDFDGTPIILQFKNKSEK